MRLRLYRDWQLSALANVAYVLVGTIGRTLRVQTVNDGEFERRIKNNKGQVLVTWHGRVFIPLVHYRGRPLFTIISPSRDGEIQYRMFRKFGWAAARGSSGRDATKATLAGVRKLREGASVTLAPDGPKGPAGVAHPGALYLAMKSGCPLLPVGVSVKPAWTLGSWDSFLFPKPFARAVIVFGEPMMIPPDTDDSTLKSMAATLGEKINEAQRTAAGMVGES